MEYVRATFDHLINRHRNARSRLQGVATGNGLSLVWREAYGYVQARLLAICFPEECLKVLSQVLSADGVLPEDHIIAIKALSVLSSSGNSQAESILVRLAHGTDPSIASMAMDELFSGDKVGKHRALYWSKCSQGVREAIPFGPYWADGQTRAVLERVFAARPIDSPDYRIKEALERMAILESPERASKLDQLLRVSSDKTDHTENVILRQRWALRVAQQNPTENSLEILRIRLDNDEINAARLLAELGASGPPDPTGPGYVQATRDEFYDEALLTYQSLGGKLNENQIRRLTRFGYLGDPYERLKALLK